MAGTRRVTLVGLSTMMSVMFSSSSSSSSLTTDDSHLTTLGSSKFNLNSVDHNDDHNLDDKTAWLTPDIMNELMKDPLILGLLKSAGFTKESQLDGDGVNDRCISMTYNFNNCTMVLQLPDMTYVVTSLREAWEEGGLQVLGTVLRIMKIFNQSCHCFTAQVDPGCPDILFSVKNVVDMVCNLR